MREVLFRLSIFGREIPFYSYGFCFGLGVFFAAHLSAWIVERDGIPRAKTFLYSFGIVAGGLIGGRLHALATDVTLRGSAGLLEERGFTYFGAALSGFASAYPMARLLKIDFWKITDATAPGLALAHALGRLGCFFAGCCYGAPCDAWFAIRFPRGSAPWQDEVAAGAIHPDDAWSLGLYPTQLIELVCESIATVVLARILIARIRGDRPSRSGSVILGYFLYYGLLRAAVEVVRGDPGRGLLLGLSTSTTIGLATAAVCWVLIFFPPLARLRPMRAPAEPIVTKP